MTAGAAVGGPSVFGVSFGFAPEADQQDVEPVVAEHEGDERPVDSLVAIRAAQRSRLAPGAAVREAVGELLSSSGLPLGPPEVAADDARVHDRMRPVALPAGALLTTPSGSRIVVEVGGTAMLGRLPDCDVLIDDPSISRRHCCVCAASDAVTVRDLGSSNGTWINRGGTRVPVPAGLEVALLDNDWLFASSVPLVHIALAEPPS